MTEELTATFKQVGLELIDMSDRFAENMQTWGDLLAQNPESETATMSAGFINKSSEASGLEMVIDVQALPDKKPVLRTWAIETKIDGAQQEYFNNIQVTFEADDQQVRSLIAKGQAITREDIRALLQDETTRLTNIIVSNESGGNGAGQTRGERYDFTAVELREHPDDAAKVTQTVRTVVQALKQSLIG